MGTSLPRGKASASKLVFTETPWPAGIMHPGRAPKQSALLPGPAGRYYARAVA